MDEPHQGCCPDASAPAMRSQSMVTAHNYLRADVFINTQVQPASEEKDWSWSTGHLCNISACKHTV